MSLNKLKKELSIDARSKLLNEVAQSRNDITNNFINRTAEQQGLQLELQKVYKPLLTAISEQPKTIVSKIDQLTTNAKSDSATVQRQIEELKQIQTKNEKILSKIHESPQLPELIELIKTYPNIIDKINDDDVILTDKEQKIYDMLQDLPENNRTLLREYFIMPTPPSSPIFTPRQSRIPILLPEYIRTITPEEINAADDAKILDFKQYLIENPDIPIDGRFKPYIWFIARDSNFVKDIKIGRQTKHGTGVKFLSSNPKSLKIELQRLIGSYMAGNKDTFNEISAITDELRRSGELSIKDVKSIMKTLITKFNI